MNIKGYAAVFDVPDRGGDIVRKEAFRDLKCALDIPLLHRHNPRRPAGRITYSVVNDYGLYVEAELDQPLADEGLSFGYRIIDAKRTDYLELLHLELCEVSIVMHPMQPKCFIIKDKPNDQ